jgi:hypothetical protein
MEIDAVQASMNEGLQQMKKYLINMCRDVCSASEELEKADPTFPIHWTRCIKAFIVAAELTAHQCYLEWFQANFRGTKRPFDDTDYVEDADSADCGDSAADDCVDAGDNDTRPVAARTRSNNLRINAATLPPPPINRSQSSKRRNVGAFNDPLNVE